MNTQHNNKEAYTQTNCPLLDEEFDLFSPEVSDFLISNTHLQDETPYMMSFRPVFKKRAPWLSHRKT